MNKTPMSLLGFLVFLLFTGFPGNSTAQKLDPSKFAPGKSLTIPMPDKGKRVISKCNEPVRTRIILPDNFQSSRSHPVWVHMPAGKGDAADVKRWADFMNRKNYVFVSVDYTCKRGYKGGFSLVKFVLKSLVNAPGINLKTRGMVVSGKSSGAYAISISHNSSFGKLFGAYILVAGGLELSPPAVGKSRAVYWAIGSEDTKKASAGRSRVAVVRKSHRRLKGNGLKSTLNEIDGKGHGIGIDDFGEDLRKWVYRWAPPFRKFYAYKRRMEQTDNPSDKREYAQKIHSTWLEFPWKDEVPSPGN